MAVDLHLYAGLYDDIVLPIIDTIRGRIGNVVDGVRPILLFAIVGWMALIGFDLAQKQKSMRQLLLEGFQVALCVAALASGATYMLWVGDMFLTGIVKTFSLALGGKTPMDALDHIQNLSASAGYRALEALPNYSFKSIFVGLVILAYIAITFICSGYSFLIFVASVGITAVCVFIGPIAIACAAFRWTRKFANGWLGVMVAGVVTQILCVGIMVMVSDVEAKVILPFALKIAADMKAGTDHIGEMFHGICQSACVLALCTYLVYHTKAIAYGIAHGVHHHVGLLEAATFGMAARALQTGRQAAGNAGAAAQRRLQAGHPIPANNNRPIGPNLSRGRMSP